MKKIITILFLLSGFAFAQTPSLAINEIHADPDPTLGDANGDGTVSTDNDEFIELFNNSGSSLDISNWTITVGTNVVHTFPLLTVVPIAETICIFDGGTLTNIPGLAQISNNDLSLNNDGDDVIIKDNLNNTITSYTYGNEANDNQSIARSPDVTGSFVKHLTITTNPILFSPGRDNTDNFPLPVELTTFTASTSSATGSKSVELNWQTATEVNNYGFEIERASTPLSMNSSRAETREWKKIAFVEGHGNSNSPKYYSFSDKTVNLSGTYLYRLKQIDIDGKFEYSDEVEINFGTPEDFELTQNYPNPFNPTTKIQFNLPVESQVKLSVFNILGEQVSELVNKNLQAGIHSVEFNANKLNSGIYFYKLEANSFMQIRKMMLVK